MFTLHALYSLIPILAQCYREQHRNEIALQYSAEVNTAIAKLTLFSRDNFNCMLLLPYNMGFDLNL